MKYKVLLLASLLSLLIASPVSAAYVTKVVITTQEPKVGEQRVFKASVPPSASTEVTDVFWGGTLDNGKFIQGNDYTITVKLMIKSSSSNVFSTSQNINVTINGKKARLSNVSSKNLTVKYTWKELGGPNVNAPDYKLKMKLSQLAASYIATSATNDKDVLNYLRSKLPRAEIWCAGGSYKYTRKLPSQTNDGNFAMTIGITEGGITIQRYNFIAVIPALNKSPEAMMLNADVALMKAALSDLTVTAKTTGKQVLAAVNGAAKNGSKAVWDNNYKYTSPTATQRGSIVGNAIVSLGDKREIIAIHKVLPIAGNATDAAIDADVSAMSKALRNYTLTNHTTKEDLLKVANAALTNGSKLVCTSFSILKATRETDGKIIANFELKLKTAQRIPRFSKKIPTLTANLPTDFAINQDEWEVLRLTNIERYKQGLPLYVMVNALQTAADIRAKEIITDFRKDHSRPDGSAFSTAIDRSFAAARRLGENAYQFPTTPTQAVKGWMESTGHRANILNSMFTYLGVGVAKDKGSRKHWIQMFSSGSGVTRAETSTGSYTFNTIEDMENEYLICYAADGTKAYIPLSADYMAKNGNDYTMNLHGKYITVTVKEE